jgi:hypothetical protein
MSRPEPRTNLPDDFDDVLNMCEKYINECEEYDRPYDNLNQLIFEELMEYVYGEDVFDWINKKCN